MKIVIAQLNPTVGAIEANLEKVKRVLEETAGECPDLLILPELYLVGYPPKDLLERGYFIEEVQRSLRKLAEISEGYPETGILLGAPVPNDKEAGKGLDNAALLIFKGQILFRQAKSLLPSYDVFDETRYFDAADEIRLCEFKGEKLGISICEDAWNEETRGYQGRVYAQDPIAVLAEQGATLLINISASPFYAKKEEVRFGIVQNHASRHGLPFVYVNQVGGNDELIFDGRSFAVDADGEPVVVCPAFQESVSIFQTEEPGKPERLNPVDSVQSVYDALVLGIRDYLQKTGFSKAIVGLSGGIDSALTCVLAAEAVGRENVLGISMPSPFSSQGSVEDSRVLAANLGVDFKVIPITEIYNGYLYTLRPYFVGRETDATEENIQARIRGNILMAFSNKFGHLLLSTGNKSEMAVGYCTLYGDMSGGLSVLSDVPKTMVYQLSRHINREKEIIPWTIIDKAPSAELRPNQLDQDTLPPYPVLDAILNGYIEEGHSADELVAQGFDRTTVEWVIRAINRNEYKRRQAAPGLKVTTKAFGVGRRMPVAAKY